MSLICGPCALGKHDRCTGLLRTEFGFCSCWTREHADRPAGDAPTVRARNEAIYLAYVRATLHAGEA